MKQSKNVTIIIGVFVLVSLVIAGGVVYMRSRAPEPAPVFPVNKVPLETVFEQAAKNEHFVQVSLTSIDGFKDGYIIGNGRIRYSDGKQIFGYGAGKLGAVVAMKFNDTTSTQYKACEQILRYEIAMGRELFISGEGTSQTAPPSNTAGSARVEFSKLDQCGLITAFKR